jgi:DNA-binding CsgD family transcriptional regulator
MLPLPGLLLEDHVKTIFAKLGVSSRPELTPLLLDI